MAAAHHHHRDLVLAAASGVALGACAVVACQRSPAHCSLDTAQYTASLDTKVVRGDCCIGTVTLHAVIDENFTVADFVPAITQRASLAEAFPVGKGISCGWVQPEPL